MRRYFHFLQDFLDSLQRALARESSWRRQRRSRKSPGQSMSFWRCLWKCYRNKRLTWSDSTTEIWGPVDPEIRLPYWNNFGCDFWINTEVHFRIKAEVPQKNRGFRFAPPLYCNCVRKVTSCLSTGMTEHKLIIHFIDIHLSYTILGSYPYTNIVETSMLLRIRRIPT